MNIAIIISTHGLLAEQLLKATEMLLGKQYNVAWISFLPGENIEELIKKCNNKVAELSIKSGLLFLVDVWGGSPFNAANYIQKTNDKYHIISGVNIPMLTELFMARDDHISMNKLINIALDAGRNGIRFSNNQNECDMNNDANLISNIKYKAKKNINNDNNVEKHMIIALTRIDDRLIHGQVVTCWTKETKVNRIIVINDAIASDSIRKKLLIEVAPPGITAHVVDIAKAIRVYHNPKYASDRVMLLFTNPTDIVRLIQGGVIINTINIGGMAFSHGKIQINNAISVDKKDVEAFKTLNSLGIELEVRKVSSDTPLNIMDLIKTNISKIL